jgi:TPP-dependent pyruvate/acetoin dehydrogenase alpha subunit
LQLCSAAGSGLLMQNSSHTCQSLEGGAGVGSSLLLAAGMGRMRRGLISHDCCAAVLQDCAQLPRATVFFDVSSSSKQP